MHNESILKIGLPVALSIIVVAVWIFIIIEIKRKRLEIKDIVLWFSLNIIFTISVFYIMIVNILQFLGYPEANVFNWLAFYAFGMDFNGQEWIILIIIMFIAFIVGQVMALMVKIQKLHKRVDDLNKEVAVLSGKVNRTADFDKLKVATNQKTVRETKQELKEKIKIAKAKKKAKNKMKMITQTHEISLGRKKD